MTTTSQFGTTHGVLDWINVPTRTVTRPRCARGGARPLVVPWCLCFQCILCSSLRWLWTGITYNIGVPGSIQQAIVSSRQWSLGCRQLVGKGLLIGGIWIIVRLAIGTMRLLSCSVSIRSAVLLVWLHPYQNDLGNSVSSCIT